MSRRLRRTRSHILIHQTCIKRVVRVFAYVHVITRADAYTHTHTHSVQLFWLFSSGWVAVITGTTWSRYTRFSAISNACTRIFNSYARNLVKYAAVVYRYVYMHITCARETHADPIPLAKNIRTVIIDGPRDGMTHLLRLLSRPRSSVRTFR